MKTIVKPVYYCDYCKKRYLHKGFAEKHEKHCTANPNRICRMCNVAGNEQKDLRKLLKKYELELTTPATDCEGDTIPELTKLSNDDVTALQKDVGWCAACTLSVIRQLGAATLTEFDYKAAKEYFVRNAI